MLSTKLMGFDHDLPIAEAQGCFQVDTSGENKFLSSYLQKATKKCLPRDTMGCPITDETRQEVQKSKIHQQEVLRSIRATEATSGLGLGLSTFKRERVS